MDGRFPNHHPDPTVPANLKDLREVLLAQKAEMGIAFDGDRIGRPHARLSVIDDLCVEPVLALKVVVDGGDVRELSDE